MWKICKINILILYVDLNLILNFQTLNHANICGTRSGEVQRIATNIHLSYILHIGVVQVHYSIFCRMLRDSDDLLHSTAIPGTLETGENIFPKPVERDMKFLKYV